ncbi:MAG: hypothetical protein MN733_25010 [Nitrososphaera sp.]|nr:hypothetical protein [Nitrososphaera sp.]
MNNDTKTVEIGSAVLDTLYNKPGTKRETKKMNWKVLVFSLFAFLPSAFGQYCGTEYQARFLVHVQQIPPERSTGFAGWFILPNVMNTDPFRTYTMAGMIFRSDKRWLETMAGLRLDNKGKTETTIDVRVLDQSLPWLEIFTEVEYSLTTRQWYFSPILTTSLSSGTIGIKAGAEFDFFLHPQRTSIFYGPRVSVHFPVSESIVRNVAFATAYRLQVNGEPVIRQYLLFNF